MKCVRCNQLVVETTTGYAHWKAGADHTTEMKFVELTGDIPHPLPHSHSVDTLDNFEFPEHYALHNLQVRDFLRMYYYLSGFDFQEVRAHDTVSKGHCCLTCAATCRICEARRTDLTVPVLKAVVFAACDELMKREPSSGLLPMVPFIVRIAKIVGRSVSEVEGYVQEWTRQV